MAFRIHDSVVRGEIDNRVKGTLRGKIWLEGRAEPVTLQLKGNAHPDLAGCLLTFNNPLKRVPHRHLDALNPIQRGTIGDLTASRKVRVFDVPLPDALEMIRRKEKPPEHMANCLYLEWFSEANGRVVIESADYTLKISPPEWRLSDEENEQRARDAAAGMDDFAQKLTEAIEAQTAGQKDPDAEWDEPDPDREGVDWIRTEDGDLQHPLAHRCLEAAVNINQLTEKSGSNTSNDKDFDRFVSEIETTAVKLAGALNGISKRDVARDGAFTVAYLKRALNHLHMSQAGLEAIAQKHLLPEPAIAAIRKELFEIREEILKLMEVFRGRR